MNWNMFDGRGDPAHFINQQYRTAVRTACRTVTNPINQEVYAPCGRAASTSLGGTFTLIVM